jgi:hypothetical protein
MIETGEIRSQPNFSIPRHSVTAAGSGPDMCRLEMSVVVGNTFMMGRGCGKVPVSCITLRPSRRNPTAFPVRIGLCMWETQSRYSDRLLSFCEEPVVATITSVTAKCAAALPEVKTVHGLAGCIPHAVLSHHWQTVQPAKTTSGGDWTP